MAQNSYYKMLTDFNCEFLTNNICLCYILELFTQHVDHFTQHPMRVAVAFYVLLAFLLSQVNREKCLPVAVVKDTYIRD